MDILYRQNVETEDTTQNVQGRDESELKERKRKGKPGEESNREEGRIRTGHSGVSRLRRER